MANRGKKTVIAIYVRVSTAKQETESQVQAIAKWCVHQKYPKAEIIEFIDKGVSGATTDRLEFKRMMLAVEAGTIDRIVTFELSRISRDIVDTMNIMRVLAQRNVIVEVPGEGVKPFKTAMDQFMTAVAGFANAQQKENIRKATRSGLAAARGRGVRLGPPPGNQNRRGKTKNHDADFLDKLKRLTRKLTVREIALEMKISPATVSRLQRLYRLKTKESATPA